MSETLRRATGSACRHQRSRAGHAARRNALRAWANIPNTTAFLSRKYVDQVSGKGDIPPLPGTTKLSRGFLQQARP